MVPSKYLLISIIFLTLPEPMYIPPVSTISSSTSHGSKQISVDLNNFLDTARTNVHSTSSSTVNSKQHSTLVLESKSGGSMIKVHGDIIASLIFQNSSKIRSRICKWWQR